MKMHRLLLLLHVLCVGLFGQTQPKPVMPVVSPAPPPGITVSDPAYPLPLEERDRIRDLQHLNDQLEIDNQKMLVKIEQNKARQKETVDKELDIALKFAEARKIDLSSYELEPAEIKFVKIKAKSK